MSRTSFPTPSFLSTSTRSLGRVKTRLESSPLPLSLPRRALLLSPSSLDKYEGFEMHFDVSRALFPSSGCLPPTSLLYHYQDRLTPLRGGFLIAFRPRRVRHRLETCFLTRLEPWYVLFFICIYGLLIARVIAAGGGRFLACCLSRKQMKIKS